MWLEEVGTCERQHRRAIPTSRKDFLIFREHFLTTLLRYVTISNSLCFPGVFCLEKFFFFFFFKCSRYGG